MGRGSVDKCLRFYCLTWAINDEDKFHCYRRTWRKFGQYTMYTVTRQEKKKHVSHNDCQLIFDTSVTMKFDASSRDLCIDLQFIICILCYLGKFTVLHCNCMHQVSVWILWLRKAPSSDQSSSSSIEICSMLNKGYS